MVPGETRAQPQPLHRPALVGGHANPEEVVLALSSALRGESEPIRRFGVLLDEESGKLKAFQLGLANATGTVNDHARGQARTRSHRDKPVQPTNRSQTSFLDTLSSSGCGNHGTCSCSGRLR